ncbi:ABC transporter permease [Candidatus Desulforudis audaxviator]|uniref:Transport permease protein n=1 Tax=Desulforudis audaxviator (strain MP104C) TaxID=477974 RepID=B1I3U3_DESAP|nr:ABC transporter permease [Candidatus Desulforudis audaxviator]ACA59717.1 ABC-2 type transporter [Candidatus Desulforudis audaxviator MP104C]AZK59711.1 ABC-type multidrug transport system, permease component [Candidatus Desulforudis audaxviator]
MDSYTVFWREMLVFKRTFWKFLASRLVSPVLYLVAFGWGLGRSIHTDGGSYLDFVVPGIIALSAMTVSFNATGVSLNMSRLYHKTLEEYLIAPISSLSFVLGKVLAGMVRGLVGALVILGLGTLFGAHPVMGPWFFAVIFLTCFLFAALGVVAAMTVPSHEDMANFSTFVILPMAFLCGTFFRTEHLPGIMADAVYALPLTHTSYALRSLAGGAGLPVSSLLILVAYATVFFSAAVWVTRRIR